VSTRLDERSSDRYAQTAFASAAPIQQRLAMLDGAIRAAQRTAHAIRTKAPEDAHRCASIGRALMLELLATLRHDGAAPPSPSWRALLVHAHGRLSRAIAQHDAADADQCGSLLAKERDAWHARIGTLRADPSTRRHTNAVA